MITDREAPRAQAAAFPRGEKLLNTPLLNKGTAFTEAERDALGLRGLLPPRVSSMEEQVRRVRGHLAAKTSDLEKYIYLTALQDRNETLFYRVLTERLRELMPIVYTPTVGQACQEYGHIFRRPRGLFVSAEDAGRVDAVLANWPADGVRVVVVTDGERILGLGDLGANGMGISVGKLALYTACGGVAPELTLPVTLDVGTNNQALRDDPLYLGLRRPRLRGKAYDELVEEFVQAVEKRYPGALLQFEDFANTNAFPLLARYRDRVCSFNDDIQGTAAVCLAGLYSALRITGGDLREQTILSLGAGAAAIGIGDLICSAMVDAGASPDEARRRCWFVDSQGLVTRGRGELAEHKRPYAHEHPPVKDLLDAIRTLKPTILLGVSGQPRVFTHEIIAEMAACAERPAIFALSNPTSRAECTAEEAYRWSQGRAIFASGSPFAPVELDGKTFVPGQGNNAYIFPGLGLGVLASASRRVTNEMFFVAAKTLAAQVAESDLETGCLYPPLERIREVSAEIARAVAGVAYCRGLAGAPRPADLAAHIRASMYEPVYRDFAR